MLSARWMQISSTVFSLDSHDSVLVTCQKPPKVWLPRQISSPPQRHVSMTRQTSDHADRSMATRIRRPPFAHDRRSPRTCQIYGHLVRRFITTCFGAEPPVWQASLRTPVEAGGSNRTLWPRNPSARALPVARCLTGEMRVLPVRSLSPHPAAHRIREQWATHP
jgi:hypothetical protein